MCAVVSVYGGVTQVSLSSAVDDVSGAEVRRGVYPPRAYGRHRSVSTEMVAGVYPPRAYGQSRCGSTEMREHAREAVDERDVQ